MKNLRRIGRTVICALTGAASLLPSAFAAEAVDSFDTPIETVNVTLGPSRYYHDPSVRGVLTCYYYPQLVVKEYSEGGSGADLLSIARHRGKPPRCELAQRRGEHVIDASEWHGFFKGVKDALVFFDADDDFNGDSPFAVFDSRSGKKIFQDSGFGEHASSPDYRTARVQVTATSGGYLLKYKRVAYADCNLYAQGRACWERIEADLGLGGRDMPVCTGYEHIAVLTGTEDVESMVAYPVEVSLFPDSDSDPDPDPVAGAIECWPAQ